MEPSLLWDMLTRVGLRAVDAAVSGSDAEELRTRVTDDRADAWRESGDGVVEEVGCAAASCAAGGAGEVARTHEYTWRGPLWKCI